MTIKVLTHFLNGGIISNARFAKGEACVYRLSKEDKVEIYLNGFWSSLWDLRDWMIKCAPLDWEICDIGDLSKVQESVKNAIPIPKRKSKVWVYLIWYEVEYNDQSIAPETLYAEMTLDQKSIYQKDLMNFKIKYNNKERYKSFTIANWKLLRKDYE